MFRIPGRFRRYLRPMVKADAVIDAWRHLPLADAPALIGSNPVLILAPHPDDESLGCGGLIADCQARGQPVYVVVLTDGAGSHPKSRAYPAARLTALRAEETRTAMAALGLPPERVEFVGLPDGHAPLHGRRFAATVQRLVAYAKARGIGTICTTWGGDPHHDHQAAYRLGRAVAAAMQVKLFCYPVWGWMLPAHAWVPAGPTRGARLNIAEHVAAKQQAIACHRSQTTAMISDDPDAFRMSPEFLAIFAQPYEVFIDVPHDAAG